MNDFKQDIFSTPLWISNREDDGEFNKNVANLVYKFRDNVYANLHYNWWGVKFTDQIYSDYRFNRLLLILSVEL